MKYRTLYNYLRDFGEFFSEGARLPKKGKRWTAEDVTTIQTIRHLHSERRSQEEIIESLREGFTTPLVGGYSPEDVNRLIEASWLMLGQAEELLQETKKQFKRCEYCEWDLRYHIENGFYKTILRYEEFDHELKQIKLIVGKISDSHLARQERDEEYKRLHKWIRFHFLAEEERREKIIREQEQAGLETQKAKLQLVHDTRAMVKWIYDKLPRRSKRPKELTDGDKINQS